MSDTKIIHGNLDEIVEAVVNEMYIHIGEHTKMSLCEQDIRTAIERFVVEEQQKCIIHSTDMKGICFKCGKDTTPKKGGDDEAG